MSSRSHRLSVGPGDAVFLQTPPLGCVHTGGKVLGQGPGDVCDIENQNPKDIGLRVWHCRAIVSDAILYLSSPVILEELVASKMQYIIAASSDRATLLTT